MKNALTLLVFLLHLLATVGARASGSPDSQAFSPIDRPAYLKIAVTQRAERSTMSEIFSHEAFKPVFDSRNHTFGLALAEGLKETAFHRRPRLLNDEENMLKGSEIADPDTFRLEIDLRLSYGLRETNPLLSCLSVLGCLFFSPFDILSYEGYGIARVTTIYTTPEGETIPIDSKTFRHSETIRCDYIDLLNARKEIEWVDLLHGRILSRLSSEILRVTPAAIVLASQQKAGRFLGEPPLPPKKIVLCRLLAAEESGEEIPPLRQETASLPAANESIQAVVRHAAPSIFEIETERGGGSGFVISESGYGVTSLDTVRGCKRVEVRFQNGEPFSARVVLESDEVGLAILTLNGWSAPPLPVASKEPASVMEETIILGYFSGSGLTVIKSVGSAGIVEKSILDLPKGDLKNVSGAPIINLQGEVVGILISRQDMVEKGAISMEKARDFLNAFTRTIASPET